MTFHDLNLNFFSGASTRLIFQIAIDFFLIYFAKWAPELGVGVAFSSFGEFSYIWARDGTKFVLFSQAV